MGTNSAIGVTTRTSTDEPVHGYKVVYGHWDGYPSHMGLQLALIGDRENWDIELIGKTLLAHDWSVIDATEEHSGPGHTEQLAGWGRFYTDVFHGPTEGDLVNGPADHTWLYLFDGPTRTLSVYRGVSSGDAAYRLLVLIGPKETEGELGDRLLELERTSAWW